MLTSAVCRTSAHGNSQGDQNQAAKETPIAAPLHIVEFFFHNPSSCSFSLTQTYRYRQDQCHNAASRRLAGSEESQVTIPFLAIAAEDCSVLLGCARVRS